MLAESKASGERDGGGNKKRIESPGVTQLPTLADIGISKSQSSRWHKLAAIPETQFESAVAAALEIAGEANRWLIVSRAAISACTSAVPNKC